jgi:WD40 repeat protein
MTSAQTASYDLGARLVSPMLKRSELRLVANVTAATMFGDGGRVAFALGDGSVRLRDVSGSGGLAGRPVFGGTEVIAARHAGAATALERFQGGFVSAGQDGRVVGYSDTAAGTRPLFDFGECWVDALAAHEPTGRIAAAADRRLVVIDRTGRLLLESSAFPSTIAGLSFAPEGHRIAAAHLDGVSIISIDRGERELQLAWKGSHIGVRWSPDGRYVVSATQERELHVWDLVTLGDLRLGGYPHKIHGLHWLTHGPFLVCTGADVITAWSFADAGPAGKPPIEIGYVYNAIVTAVAANPVRTLVAGGYSNGSLLVGGIAKGEALIARCQQGDAISALSWSPDGGRLVAGTAAGHAVVVDVPKDLGIR